MGEANPLPIIEVVMVEAFKLVFFAFFATCKSNKFQFLYKFYNLRNLGKWEEKITVILHVKQEKRLYRTSTILFKKFLKKFQDIFRGKNIKKLIHYI